MDKKIIILARISTAPQDIQSQTNDLKREAERLGYDESNQIIIESVESAIKLSEEERLGIQRMKYYIENDPNIDCVICWEPSRLARQQKILYSLRDYLVQKKIQLIILNPYVKLLSDDRTQVDTTANIVFSLFATISENEMTIKKERFQRAKNEMKARGQKFGGATIFGYLKNKDKKCVPHPIYGNIIVDLFNHYVTTDDSLYETYLYATSKYPETFPVKEYKEAQRKINHLFDKEIYVTGNWCYPPLITKKVWDKTHEKKKNARCYPRFNCKRPLLCRGRIFCGYCGHMMTGCGGSIKAYMCSNKNKEHSLQINRDIADWIMWEETKTAVNINSFFSDSLEYINEAQRELDAKIELKKQYENKIQTLKEQSSKLLDVYINNRINENVFNKRIDEINESLRIFTKNVDKLNTEIAAYQTLIEDTKNKWGNINPLNVENITDFATKQEYVRKYIKRMIVNRDEERPRSFRITFEFARPIITARSEYIYTYRNQSDVNVFRINEDGTEDLILSYDNRRSRNKKTGRFEKIVDSSEGVITY